MRSRSLKVSKRAKKIEIRLLKRFFQQLLIDCRLSALSPRFLLTSCFLIEAFLSLISMCDLVLVFFSLYPAGLTFSLLTSLTFCFFFSFRSALTSLLLSTLGSVCLVVLFFCSYLGCFSSFFSSFCCFPSPFLGFDSFPRFACSSLF